MTIIPNWRRAWRMASMQVVGDAQWQRVEGAVEWPKGVTAADLFDLTATI